MFFFFVCLFFFFGALRVKELIDIFMTSKLLIWLKGIGTLSGEATLPFVFFLPHRSKFFPSKEAPMGKGVNRKLFSLENGAKTWRCTS